MATLTSRSVVETKNKTIKQGEKQVMINDELLKNVLAYVRNVCVVRGMSYADADDAASVAVTRAMDTYKEGQGCAFKTWAVTMLKQHAWKTVAKMHCPVSQTKGRGNGNGYSAAVGVVELDAERRDGRNVSETFDAEGHNGIEAALLDSGASEEAVDFVSEDVEPDNAEMLVIALDTLPEKLAHVVRENYLNNRTLESLAIEQGVTKQAVSLQVKKGLAMLRETLATLAAE
jgi:RNA polymerase sigma factor (sigma-70 family)